MARLPSVIQTIGRCRLRARDAITNAWAEHGIGGKQAERPSLKRLDRPAENLSSNSWMCLLHMVSAGVRTFADGMLGCEVRYTENHPPAVISANNEELEIDIDAAFNSKVYKEFLKLTESLKSTYGYLTGDVNWGGVLNIAMDLRGDQIMMDMLMSPREVKSYFNSIAAVIDKFTGFVASQTGTTSISVTRSVRHLPFPVFLHSECSHTMISCDDYEQFLMPIDARWSREKEYFGIHYCGEDPHRYAESFARLPKLDFLDLGWGGDVAHLRKHLPDTFFNIRLSPVELVNMTVEEIQATITKLLTESANPALSGVCCINMDDRVTDDKIDAIFETVLNYE